MKILSRRMSNMDIQRMNTEAQGYISPDLTNINISFSFSLILRRNYNFIFFSKLTIGFLSKLKGR